MSVHAITTVLNRLSQGEEVSFDELNFDPTTVKARLRDFSDASVATAIYSLRKLQQNSLAEEIQLDRFNVIPRLKPEDYTIEEKKLKIYSLNSDQHVAIGKYVDAYCRSVPDADAYRKERGAIWDWKETTVLRYNPRDLEHVDPLCFSYTTIEERRTFFDQTSVVKKWEEK